MNFTKHIENKLKNKKRLRKILFIDGHDIRAQKAAKEHQLNGILIPILLLEKKSDVKDLNVKSIIIEEWKDKEDILINKYLEKRKGKEDINSAKKVIYNREYFAMLMIELNEVDGAIGGLTCPTSDLLRPAFKIIGTKNNIKTISSVMIMEKSDQWYIFSDISVNIEPNVEQLVDIATNAYNFSKSIDIDPKIAFLSFSTSGSAVHLRSTQVKDATDIFNKKMNLENDAIGEVQFDTAFAQDIRDIKYGSSSFDGPANIYIFPSLEAGNIGYKIAQRLGNFGAIGPIITGVNKPINDLSRGALTKDVYNTALLTAIQVND